MSAVLPLHAAWLLHQVESSVRCMQVLSGAHITSTALAQLAHTASVGRLHRTFSKLLPANARQGTVSTLYSIAQTLLQQWGDARVVRSWQPRESASLTHTVMLLVLGLGAEGVEQSSAVMQALLQVCIWVVLLVPPTQSVVLPLVPVQC